MQSASGTHPFSRYELRRRLGKGGMGVVYRAWDTVDKREVALKIGEVPSDEAAAVRLMREIRHASAVRDPHVCAVLGTGTTDSGAIFLAMEVVDGPTCTDLAKRSRSCPSLWIEAFRALLLGLAAVHEKGITHRDVKPQNVMFDANGILKLLDFGIARSVQDETVTGTGQVIGTPAYMSPEQARAEGTDARSDLFSAALTVANLAGRGSSRFASTQFTLAQKVLRAAYWSPPLLLDFDPATPPELEDVFGHALTLKPADRAKDARELIALIDECPIRHPLGEQWLSDWVLGVIDENTALTYDAAREVERARLIANDRESQPARVLAWRRASLLTPTPPILENLERESAKGGFRFDEDFDEPRRKVLEAMEQKPPNPEEIRRASELFKRSGHIEVSSRLLWSYVRLRPDDIAAVRLLDRSLLGSNTSLSLSIARGIKTGGLAAAASYRPKDDSRTMEALAAIGAPEASAASPAGSSQNRSGGNPSRVQGVRSGSSTVPDREGLPRFLMPAVVVLAAAAITWILIVTVRTARDEFSTQEKRIENQEVITVVDTRLTLLDSAEASLKDKDFTAAIDESTRALGLDLSMESGRRALLIRAQARIALGDRGPARRDLELYIERSTSFSDPNLATVKRLLASLDAPDLNRPRE